MNAFTIVEVAPSDVERLEENRQRMRELEQQTLARRRSLGAGPFARLPYAERRALATVALRAHPNNPEHRRRWVRARRFLDLHSIPVRVAVGGGIGQVRAVSELSRWEKAARAVC